VKSLEEAMRRHEAPFYLRRLKEALVAFPDPETGEVKKLFTNRDVRTTKFELDGEEFDFYDALTRYVEDQSIKAAAAENVQANILGFQMAMLQRRFASSMYAVRRSLERMRDKRRKILDDPEKYRQEQIDRGCPTTSTTCPKTSRRRSCEREETVLIGRSHRAPRGDSAARQARRAGARPREARGRVEAGEAQAGPDEQQIFSDPRMKLLVFTEHKDTLDYLAGDGRTGARSASCASGALPARRSTAACPSATATRRTRASTPSASSRGRPGARRHRSGGRRHQPSVLLVDDQLRHPVEPRAPRTAHGPHPPLRPAEGLPHLQLRGVNTREGRVLEKLLMRLAEIKDELGTDKVFDVVGEMLPSNALEKMFREMYAKRLDVTDISDRIVKDIDPERFKRITGSTLEGLAKKELNLSALVGKSVEAKERRLVPEVIEDFFKTAGPIAGVHPSPVRGKDHVYRSAKCRRPLTTIGERLEPRFGKLGREYQRVVFDKRLLGDDATLEWVTPGHPLFEVVRPGPRSRGLRCGERGVRESRLRSHRPQTPPGRPEDLHPCPLRRGEGPGLHRRGRAHLQRVQDRRAPQTGLLALRRLPLRQPEALAQHPARSGPPALAAHREDRALPLNLEDARNPKIEEDQPADDQGEARGSD
jgi:hypothetical protein